ncbi:DUF397 domain-containing protein [Actinoplanes sp. CA-252034]|uniref:DUF397 domain-containing protein n=1 Tax=Actinoplanes sp. CA-252034 TaxID=3239906 RepID=UPI003D969137
MDLADATWRKSRRSSDDGTCVEVAVVAGGVAVRDSKNREGGALKFTYAEWVAFIGGIKAGAFDLPA